MCKPPDGGSLNEEVRHECDECENGDDRRHSPRPTTGLGMNGRAVAVLSFLLGAGSFFLIWVFSPISEVKQKAGEQGVTLEFLARGQATLLETEKAHVELLSSIGLVDADHKLRIEILEKFAAGHAADSCETTMCNEMRANIAFLNERVAEFHGAVRRPVTEPSG